MHPATTLILSPCVNGITPSIGFWLGRAISLSRRPARARRDGPPNSRQGYHAGVPSDAPQKPVLVADDQDQLLRLCRRVLGRSGYPVLPARNGDEAARLFAAHRGDVRAVVIDATLPPRGAAAALEEIWKMSDDVGVVFTSGDDLDESLHALRLDRAGVFLRKPFAAAALVRAVQDAQRRFEA